MLIRCCIYEWINAAVGSCKNKGNIPKYVNIQARATRTKLHNIYEHCSRGVA